MATKLAIKDVARVQKLPLSISNNLCKLIPDKLPEGPDGKVPKMNLTNAIAAIPELREAETSSDILLRDTIRYAKCSKVMCAIRVCMRVALSFVVTIYQIGYPYLPPRIRKPERNCTVPNMRGV